MARSDGSGSDCGTVIGQILKRNGRDRLRRVQPSRTECPNSRSHPGGDVRADGFAMAMGSSA